MIQDALLDSFIRHLRVERGLVPNTCLSYGYQLGGYLTFLRERGREPAVVTREDVLAYLECRKGDGLKSASLFIAAMAVRQFHRYLVEGRTHLGRSDRRDAPSAIQAANPRAGGHAGHGPPTSPAHGGEVRSRARPRYA